MQSGRGGVRLEMDGVGMQKGSFGSRWSRESAIRRDGMMPMSDRTTRRAAFSYPFPCE